MKAKDLYITDTTEEDKYGDTQVLIAKDEEEEKGFEKTGNQKEEYYECIEMDKVEIKDSDGSRLILEVGKKFVSVHVIQAPDWDEMVTDFPKDKFFKAIRRLNE